MKKWCLIWSLIAIAGSVVSFGLLSPMTIHPLKGVQEVNLQIMIGGTLGLDGGTRLFGADRDRTEHFENELRNAITTKLQEYGIVVSENAKNEIALSFRGRTIEGTNCVYSWIFVFELYLVNSKFEQLCDDSCFVPAMSTKIGISSNEELETTLMNYAIFVLSESLSEMGTSEGLDASSS